METNKFVCMSLGIDGKVIDDLCDEFDVDFDDADVINAMNQLDGSDNHWAPGQYLLEIVYGNIVNSYPELDKSKFDYDVSSPSYPSLTYDGMTIETKKQLDELANREQ